SQTVGKTGLVLFFFLSLTARWNHLPVPAMPTQVGGSSCIHVLRETFLEGAVLVQLVTVYENEQCRICLYSVE
ncbi:hypothetical protein BHM03_00050106, partial [Ensete ventricosum]